MSTPGSAGAVCGRFPTTAWSVIRVVQDQTHPEHQAATDHFVTLYWRPVFYFLRAHGNPRLEAEDLTQDFLVRFLKPDAVARADQDKGRFRTFLLTVLKRFVIDRDRSREGKQDQFERQFVPIARLMGEEDRTFEPAAGETPEEAFNRQWAIGVWEKVRAELGTRYADEEGQTRMAIFTAYYAPTGKRPSQEKLAAAHRLPVETVRKLLKQTRNRFDGLLRAELRAEFGSEAEVDDELRELRRWLE